jgi:hypothetical protein
VGKTPIPAWNEAQMSMPANSPKIGEMAENFLGKWSKSGVDGKI